VFCQRAEVLPVYKWRRSLHRRGPVIIPMEVRYQNRPRPILVRTFALRLAQNLVRTMYQTPGFWSILVRTPFRAQKFPKKSQKSQKKSQKNRKKLDSSFLNVYIVLLLDIGYIGVGLAMPLYRIQRGNRKNQSISFLLLL
jgi:hypothetical protein